MSKKFNPNAAVIVYNYIDRQGDYNLNVNRRDKVEELVIESELISIQTQKTKSQPSGSFTITLAPTKNWVTKLTPGSWLSIHMSPKKLKRSDPNKGGILSFDSKTLKMIGRIDTVQMSVSVNQETGARETYFVISGRDWGQIFETILYIDPMASISADTALEQVVRFNFDANLVKAGNNSFSSTSLLNFFIDIWGKQTGSFSKFKESFRAQTQGLNLDADRIMPNSVFYLPKELHERFFLQEGTSDGTNTLANNINIVSGRLVGEDKYKDEGEIGGLPNTGAIVGGNSLWQILNAHCGAVVNEMLTDFRWDKNRLVFSLYKRVRPFLLDEDSTTQNGKKISSSFFLIKKTQIEKDRVITIQAGTNWRDKINFLEVLPQMGHVIPGYEWVTPMTKSSGCAAYDKVSFGRDGFKPLLFSTPFIPFKNGKPDNFENMKQWIPVMQKWYFNNHKMLNGTVSISNQEEYIGVGENLVLDGTLFSSSFHVNGDTTRGEESKMLAHVESVTNNFSVDNFGTRNFVTTVSFVRGVFTDSSVDKLLDPESYGIDSDALKLKDNEERLTNIYEAKHD